MILDVLKTIRGTSLVELAEMIVRESGVRRISIRVSEVDVDTVSLTISLVSVALGVAVLTATLRRGLSVGILNAVTMAVLFTAVGLSVDSVGPLLGGTS
ncbi:MAG: hypothetical protein LM571_03440 [Desulfurococcaceae archaeon]|nr:hypothetical protein [Desulfurococcaceae archaeon]